MTNYDVARLINSGSLGKETGGVFGVEWRCSCLCSNVQRQARSLWVCQVHLKSRSWAVTAPPFRRALMKLFAEVWWTVEVIILLEVWWLGIVVEHSYTQYFAELFWCSMCLLPARWRCARQPIPTPTSLVVTAAMLPLTLVSQWISVLNFQRVPFQLFSKFYLSAQPSEKQRSHNYPHDAPFPCPRPCFFSSFLQLLIDLSEYDPPKTKTKITFTFPLCVCFILTSSQPLWSSKNKVSFSVKARRRQKAFQQSFGWGLKIIKISNSEPLKGFGLVYTDCEHSRGELQCSNNIHTSQCIAGGCPPGSGCVLHPLHAACCRGLQEPLQSVRSNIQSIITWL